MKELIDRLVNETGMTHEQASAAITVVKNFVVEKFPVLSSAVDGIFGAGQGGDEDGL